MEVDEAASHIKELVDPDANIIWGSAFNNDLGGKIRVSVVATGIDAEAGAQPQPGKVFAFPATRTAAPLAKPAIEETPLDLGSEEAPLELGSDEDTEELVLDSDDIFTSPVGAPPIAPPEDERADGERHAGSGRRRDLVRAHVEHRAWRAQGPARRRGRGAGIQERADRHPAVPQPPEQPVRSSLQIEGIDAGRLPRRGRPIFLRISDPILPAHPPLGTVHRKAPRQKGSGKNSLHKGRMMRGRMLARLGIFGALCGVAALAAAQPALAQAPYGYAQPESPVRGARPPRSHARRPARRTSALWSGQAEPRWPSATPRPQRAFSPAPTRSIRAARCPRPGWARCRSPMARRRRRCPISPAPCSSARRRLRSDATAASPTICSASRPRPRPIIASRSTAPTPTRRGAGWR